MAGADVIGTAICIALLIIVAYVVAGSILTTSGIVITTQNEMTLSQQARLETSISNQETHWHDCRIGYCLLGSWVCTSWGDVVHFWVQNTGNQPISDLSQIEVMLIWGTNRPYLYKDGSGTEGTGTYYRVGIYKDVSASPTPEDLNIGQWDPGEYLFGRIEVGSEPDYISVVLPNGLKDMRGDIYYYDLDWDC